MTPLLEAVGLAVGYNGAALLEQVDLTLYPGELVGLLGRNAAGKTTLLRALAGLRPPLSGTLALGGVDTAPFTRRDWARRVAYLPQRRELWFDLPALEVALMGVSPTLGMLQTPGPTHRATALAALERLGVAALADAGFWSLSEGQRQLVLLARALTQQAPVLLLDEPDAALDFVNRHAALGQLAALVKAEGRAALATLHDPNLALEHCHRVLVLADGGLAGEFCPGEDDRAAERLLARAFGPVTLLRERGRLFVTRGEDGDDVGDEALADRRR